MRIIRFIMSVFLLCSTTAIAAPASDESIRQLLAVTQTQKLIDGMQTQIDEKLDSFAQQVMKEKNPSPSQQQALINMHNKVTTLIHGMMAWEKLEPMYIRLYKESFTEEEVVGMLSFYMTPAGQAVIKKMPVLMQKSMLEVQSISTEMTPKMQKIQQEFIAELKATSK
jgi:hypothetical protein